MLQKFNPMAGENKSFSWWWLGVKVGVVTALVIWWWLDQKNKQQIEKFLRTDALDEADSIPLPDEVPEGESIESAFPAPSKPDDLRKIEGIGPKIQATLEAAGIETFAQLAAHKPEDLKQILVDGGIRIGYPDTWPEQAALAAAGKWDKLEDLQNSLKGGRR
jgi:predicted flap endonuclease-1-like 5' DNA nuclease